MRWSVVTLVKTKQDCLKTVRTNRRISELVRQRGPDRHMTRRQPGTMSWWRFAERRRSREATSKDVVKWSARYRGAWPVHHDSHLVSDPLWHIQPMKLLCSFVVYDAGTCDWSLFTSFANHRCLSWVGSDVQVKSRIIKYTYFCPPA